MIPVTKIRAGEERVSLPLTRARLSRVNWPESRAGRHHVFADADLTGSNPDHGEGRRSSGWCVDSGPATGLARSWHLS